jgi:hypothetical protein
MPVVIRYDAFRAGPVGVTQGYNEQGAAVDDRGSDAVRCHVATGITTKAELYGQIATILAATPTYPENTKLVVRSIQARLVDNIGIYVERYACKDSSSGDGTLWSVNLDARTVSWPWSLLGAEGLSVGAGDFLDPTFTGRLIVPNWVKVPQLIITKKFRSSNAVTDLDKANAGKLVSSDLTAGQYGTYDKATICYLGASMRDVYTGAGTIPYALKQWRYDFKGFASPYFVPGGPAWAVRAVPG